MHTGRTHEVVSPSQNRREISYLRQKGSALLEMGLLAEGWRKLATIAHRIAKGSLPGQGYLFWDKPESNLNPRLIRQLPEPSGDCTARVLIFIATHMPGLVDAFVRNGEIHLVAPETINLRGAGLAQANLQNQLVLRLLS